MACYKKKKKNSATQNAKLLLKMPISNLREIWSNTALFEFGLAKSDVRQLLWPKVEVKDNFIHIFNFILPLFKALSRNGKIIKLNNIRVIFTSYVLQYSKAHYYTKFHKTLWGHSGSTLGKNLGPPMPKLSHDSCLQERQGP